MQTFLPYADFAKSAACLDDKRLGKQRVECLQILRCLASLFNGWRNHPAVEMWAGYEYCMIAYADAVCREWKKRGFQDTCLRKIYEVFQKHFWGTDWADNVPPWFGDPNFHRSHQSNLVRKDPAHYRQFFPDVPDNLPYVWPTKKETQP